MCCSSQYQDDTLRMSVLLSFFFFFWVFVYIIKQINESYAHIYLSLIQNGYHHDEKICVETIKT